LLESPCGPTARAIASRLVTGVLVAAVVLSRPAAGDQPAPSATITVGSDAGVSIDSRFVGFSYEKSALSEPLFNAGNAALVRLFRMLGPGILRVGGNSVNETSWSADGTGGAKRLTAPPDVDQLAGFLRATDWKVLYGLNGTGSEARVNADEAAYAARALDDRLYGFEIGNEPDLYRFNGLKPKTFGFADFVADWEFRAAKIKEKLPDATLTGPAAFDYGAYAVPFAAREAGRISLLTEHYYRGDGRSADSTADLLLSPDPDLENMLAALQQAASANHLASGYRVAEANSFYNGGAPGVSNAFASALWAFTFCLSLAQHGAGGVNLHGGGNSPGYTPIADDGRGNVVGVRPAFYGLLLFSMMARDAVLTSKSTGSATALASFATGGRDGRLDVALVNKSRTESASVRVLLPQSYASGTALMLSAPDLDSTAGIAFAGAEVTAKGYWRPIEAFSLPVIESSILMAVPPGSIVLIRGKLRD
jgi:hypothetical protein